MSREPAALKSWRVTDTLGTVEVIKAHFCFREENGGLTFRYKSDTQSYVPAVYDAAQFVSCILLDPPAEPAAAPTGASPPKQASVTPFPKRLTSRRQLDDEIPF